MPTPLHLDELDVCWDWQLLRLSDRQFEALGCSPGLQAAILHVLDKGPRGRSTSDLPRLLQRFLLLPEADGSEPPRLRSVSCLLLAVMLQPQQSGSVASQDAHVSHIIFTMGELIAILAGLSIALPISLRTAVGEEVLAWEEAPASALALDTLALCVTCMLFSCIVSACAGSLMVTLSGSMDSNFHVLTILGQALMWWVLSINLMAPLVALYAYHATGHPAPAVATALLVLIGQAVMVTVMVNKIMACGLQLELLHLPRWWRWVTVLSNPPCAPFLLGDLEAKYLVAGRARAAVLIERAGYELPPAAQRFGRAVV